MQYLLFSLKKELNLETCYTMDENIMIPWKHYDKWNKPNTKDKFIYLDDVSRIGKCIETEE